MVSVQNDEAIEIGVVLPYQLGQLHPMGGRHVAAVEGLR
jgi:hypothetical protein